MSDEIGLRIARELIRKALAKGYVISVWDGEEYAVKRSADFDTINAALASTDCDLLHIRKPDGGKVGTVMLIWGNGEDVISDWSDNKLTNELCDPVPQQDGTWDDPRYNEG